MSLHESCGSSLLHINRTHSSKGSCRRGHSSTEVKRENTKAQTKAYGSADRGPLEGGRVLPPSQGIYRSSQSRRSRLCQEIQREKFPQMLRPLRLPYRLAPALAQNAGHEQSALLEMVRRRQTQRLL